MADHSVYFYGSTEVGAEQNNHIIGFEGDNPGRKLIEFAEQCLEQGETGTYPEGRITIVPFDYRYTEDEIVRHLEDALIANEKHVKGDSIEFHLIALREADPSRLPGMPDTGCCFAHYYHELLYQALANRGYAGEPPDFHKPDGTTVVLYADPGL